ncbi:hypothetical protein PVAP13_3KG366800 [Panicum virgatum]|uniref:Uncharacterized protein n=1 Tax=Panicum virgatum TaxID=38727 RepID=A0A8T0UQ34_PANVG|nr:hypothetical protein PVAP13_3KG366800 [Panicum virgatum]
MIGDLDPVERRGGRFAAMASLVPSPSAGSSGGSMAASVPSASATCSVGICSAHAPTPRHHPRVRGSLGGSMAARVPSTSATCSTRIRSAHAAVPSLSAGSSGWSMPASVPSASSTAPPGFAARPRPPGAVTASFLPEQGEDLHQHALREDDLRDRHEVVLERLPPWAEQHRGGADGMRRRRRWGRGRGRKRVRRQDQGGVSHERGMGRRGWVGVGRRSTDARIQPN